MQLQPFDYQLLFNGQLSKSSNRSVGCLTLSESMRKPVTLVWKWAFKNNFFKNAYMVAVLCIFRPTN